MSNRMIVVAAIYKAWPHRIRRLNFPPADADMAAATVLQLKADREYERVWWYHTEFMDAGE